MNAAHEPDELLTIGEMSRRTGVAVSALRYYEDLELIASVRTPGNQRRYARHMLRRVSLIAVAKRLGIPLSDVHAAFAPVPMDRSEERRVGDECRCRCERPRCKERAQLDTAAEPRV